MTTRTFELPISDCGYFVAGEIGPDSFDTNGNEPYPPYGVIVFYKTKDAAKAPVEAIVKAHWTDADGVSEDGK